MSQFQIKSKLRQNNHFRLLQIGRNCSELQLKKSYKNLALKFHPDKNSLQGAKQVFTKITNSYHLLLDQRKEQNYSEIPAKKKKQSQNNSQKQNKKKEQENMRSQNMKNENMKSDKKKSDQNQYRNANQQYQQMINDIKKRFKQWQQKQKQRQYQREQNQKRKRQYRQYLRKEQKKKKIQQQNYRNKVIFGIVIFVMIFAIIRPSQVQVQQKIFSIKMTQKYKYELKTKLLQNVYYVSDQYYSKKLNKTQQQNIELLVDKKYLIQLKKECKIIQKNIQNIQKSAFKQKIGNKRTNLLKQAKNISTKACDILLNFKLQYNQYIQILQKSD